MIDNPRTIRRRCPLGRGGADLGNWVKAYRELHAGDEPEMSGSERARIKGIEREVRELRMENEFLGKSVAFFARNTGEREVRVYRR